MAIARRPKRHNLKAERLTFTAELERCLSCGQPLRSEGCSAHSAKNVQTFDGEFYVVAYSRRCLNPQCSHFGKHYRASEHLKISLPYSTYGLDVVAYIGIQREWYHRQFVEIEADLKQQGIAINDKSVGRLYRMFLALVSGTWPQCQARLEHTAEQYGGLILLVDGLAPDGEGPKLYVMWEALSGTPICGVLLDKADTPHTTDWLRECKTLVGDLPVQATMCDGEKALKAGLQEVWPEAKHGLCQLHYLNNLAKPVKEDDQALKKELQERLAQLPGVSNLTPQEAEARIEPLLTTPETAPVKLSVNDSTEPAGPEGPQPRASSAGSASCESQPNSLTEIATKRSTETLVIPGQDPLAGGGSIEVRSPQSSSCPGPDGEVVSPGRRPVEILPVEDAGTRLATVLMTIAFAPSRPALNEEDSHNPSVSQTQSQGSRFANLLFVQASSFAGTEILDDLSSRKTVTHLEQYYGYYRRAIRDALTRPSREPFQYGGLQGYEQLVGINQALLARRARWGEDSYLDGLQRRVQSAIEATEPQAQDVCQAKDCLVDVEHCLVQMLPPPPTEPQANPPETVQAKPQNPSSPRSQVAEQKLAQTFSDWAQRTDLA